jgi:hypothetical protein
MRGAFEANRWEPARCPVLVEDGKVAEWHTAVRVATLGPGGGRQKKGAVCDGSSPPDGGYRNPPYMVAAFECGAS